MRREEVSLVQNLRRPRPLALPKLLQDCGAAADLPGAAPGSPLASVPLPRLARRPSLAFPSQAERARRRCESRRGARKRAPSPVGAWGSRGGVQADPILLRSSAGSCQPQTTRRGGTSHHPGAKRCLSEVTSQKAV